MKIQTFSIVAGTLACDAQCPYCVAKMTPPNDVRRQIMHIPTSRFKDACIYAKSHDVNTVLITGKGEPILYPKQIEDYLIALQEFNFPIIELQTNGFRFNELPYLQWLERWSVRRLRTICLSVAHYVGVRNHEIFKPVGPVVEIGDIISKLHRLDYTIRLSCVLIKNYIDSVEEINNMIAFCKTHSVEQLTFRELAVISGEDTTGTKDWIIKNKVDHETYLKMAKDVINVNSGHKLLTLPHGAEIYDIKGQNVCFNNALTCQPETDDLRQVIFFPDGHLRYDWQYPGAIIF